MILIPGPGQSPLEIQFILLDFEGTLATEGRVHPKSKDRINLLAKRTKIYILTTGEREKVAAALRKVNAEIVYLREMEASEGKMNLVQQLGAHQVVAIGNGTDDVAMIDRAGFGIGVMNREGTSGEVIGKADLLFLNVLDALDFLLKPLRQKATLSR